MGVVVMVGVGVVLMRGGWSVGGCDDGANVALLGTQMHSLAEPHGHAGR